MQDFTDLFDTCRRPAFPKLRALQDLTTDLEMAERIIKVVDSFFQLDDNYVTFSGMGRYADGRDRTGSPLFAQIWVAGKLRRSVVFRNVGLVGVLHVEIDNELGFELAVGRDMIGVAYAMSGENPDRVLAIVEEQRMEVTFEVRR